MKRLCTGLFLILLSGCAISAPPADLPTYGPIDAKLELCPEGQTDGGIGGTGQCEQGEISARSNNSRVDGR